jgi:hypothetical protein
MSCPAPFFTAPDIRARLEVRTRPYESEGRVHVYTSAPPRLDFVQRMVHAPVVTVTSNRVRVERGERPIVRVEVQGESHPHVVVPVGPKFRRVTVHSEVESSNEVKVKTEQNVQQRVRPETQSTSKPVEVQSSGRIRVESKQPDEDRPSAKVRVESKPSDEDRDNDHSVKVRTRNDNEVRTKVETK